MQSGFLVAGSKKCNKHLKQFRVFVANERVCNQGYGVCHWGFGLCNFLRICGPLVCLGFGVGNGHRGLFSACTVCLARLGNLLWLYFFFLFGRRHLSSSILRLSRCQMPCRSTFARIALLIPYVFHLWTIAIFCLQACNHDISHMRLGLGTFYLPGTTGLKVLLVPLSVKFRPAKVVIVAINVSISDININLEGA